MPAPDSRYLTEGQIHLLILSGAHDREIATAAADLSALDGISPRSTQ